MRTISSFILSFICVFFVCSKNKIQQTLFLFAIKFEVLCVGWPNDQFPSCQKYLAVKNDSEDFSDITIFVVICVTY